MTMPAVVLLCFTTIKNNITTTQASRDVLAMASLEVELGNIEVGQNVTVKWRGKPVFIRRRSEQEIAKVDDINIAALRDPQPDSARVVKPEVWGGIVGGSMDNGCCVVLLVVLCMCFHTYQHTKHQHTPTVVGGHWCVHAFGVCAVAQCW